MGCKVLATRKVRAMHHGSNPYDNYTAWGRWKTDLDAVGGVVEAQEPVRVYPSGSPRLVIPSSRENLLSELPVGGIFAEVGVWAGDFSQQILDTIKPKELHLIDPWVHQPEYPESIYGKADQDRMDGLYQTVQERFSDRPEVQLHRDFSGAALAALPDQSLDGIYLDGCHAFNVLSEDLELSRRKVKPGGRITGDDYGTCGWYGDDVTRAVNEFKAKYNLPLKLFGSQFMLEVPA
jgi:hypothetical protein